MPILIQIKNELNQLGIKPKKSLGQNFLVNEGVYRKIVAALEIKPTDTILEIGPGLGTLTEYLVQSGAKILAVEKDHLLANYLKTKFTSKNRVTIVEEDVLKFKIENLKFKIHDYKVVGNIPYYLTSHLLRIIFEDWPRPELVVLTIQKEVAQRICAKPPKTSPVRSREGSSRTKQDAEHVRGFVRDSQRGSASYRMSLLAVSVQYYAEPKVISYVSSKSFWPSPEVDSAIIRLMPRLQVTGYRKKAGIKKPETWHLTPETFFKVVRAGFAGKRKQLANNLARGLGMPKQSVEEKLKSVGVEPTRRAETLTLGEWQQLAEIMQE